MINSYTWKFLPECLEGTWSILDIGIGYGNIPYILQSNNKKISVVGMDRPDSINTDKYVDISDYKKTWMKMKWKVIQHDGNIFPWPFEDQSFDIVLSIYSIGYFKENLEQALGEIFQIAKKIVLIINWDDHADRKDMPGRFKAFQPKGWLQVIDDFPTLKWKRQEI